MVLTRDRTRGRAGVQLATRAGEAPVPSTLSAGVLWVGTAGRLGPVAALVILSRRPRSRPGRILLGMLRGTSREEPR
jgi:hypothetical protein